MNPTSIFIYDLAVVGYYIYYPRLEVRTVKEGPRENSAMLKIFYDLFLDLNAGYYMIACSS